MGERKLIYTPIVKLDFKEVDLTKLTAPFLKKAKGFDLRMMKMVIWKISLKEIDRLQISFIDRKSIDIGFLCLIITNFD